MTGRYLLDTNILIGLFKGEHNIQDELKAASSVFVPSIAIGELFYGAHHAVDSGRHLSQVKALAATASILNPDAVTAEYYGLLKHKLRLVGKPIPENDLWIAAIAIQFDLIVVSRDHHFHVVPGLSVIEW